MVWNFNRWIYFNRTLQSIKTKTWTILETNTNGISCATIGGDASTF